MTITGDDVQAAQAGSPTAATDGRRAETVRGIALGLASARGPLIPILHAVQDQLGWIDPETDVDVIADVLNLSRADVHGVLTFYHDFRRTPPPRHRAQICRGEACQAVGGQELYAAAQDRFSGSPEVEVGEVFCLGNCALGPSGFLDGKLHGRLTLERLEGWLS